MYQCIMYQFLRRMRYLYEYILNSYLQSLAASFFDIRSQGVSKVSCTNSNVDLEICMSILQTDSMCRWQHHFLAYKHGLLPKVSYTDSYVQSQICMTIF
jgi:hypothetical protein